MTRAAAFRILVVVGAAAATGVVALLFGRDRGSWRDVLCSLTGPVGTASDTAPTVVDLEPPSDDAPDFVLQMRQKLVLLAGELEATRGSGRIEYRPVVDDAAGPAAGPFSHAYAYFGRACDGLGRLGSTTDEEEARQVRSDVVCSYRAVLRVLEVATIQAEAPPDIAETDRPPHDSTVAPEALERQTETAAAGS